MRDKNKVLLRDLPCPWAETFMLCSQQASFECGRSLREGSAASIAQRHGSREAPLLLRALITRSDSHVCSLPTPRLPLWVFYNAGCQSPGNRNTWRHGFIWRLIPPRMNLVLISHCRFPRNTTILWLLLLTAQTSAASGPWEQAQPCSIHQTSVITSATRQKTSSGENDKVALAIKL